MPPCSCPMTRRGSRSRPISLLRTSHLKCVGRVTRRQTTLHEIQRLVHDRTIYVHLWQLAFLNGAGPRVGESGLGLIDGHAYSAPYEDVTLAK